MTGPAEIQGNLYSLYGALAGSGIAETGMAGGFHFIRCAGSAWPDMTYSGASAETELDIPELSAAIKAGRCPRLLALEANALSPGQLEQLHSSRFLPATEWVNMVLELPAGVAGASPRSEAPGFALDCRVIDASNTDEWGAWSALAEEVLFKKAKLAARLFRYGQDKGKLRLIVGYAGERAVSTTMLYAGERAGAYMVATRPECQGRGFGLAMMRFTASVARQFGYDTLVLHSTKPGLPLYHRLGFQAHGKLSLYYCMA